MPSPPMTNPSSGVSKQTSRPHINPVGGRAGPQDDEISVVAEYCEGVLAGVLLRDDCAATHPGGPRADRQHLAWMTAEKEKSRRLAPAVGVGGV